MSHSKRNTSLAFFTSYERSQLRGWGSQSARISSDQTLPFGSCALCLLPASQPVTCPGVVPSSAKEDASSEGKQRLRSLCHIFCRECALSSILAQKQEHKRHEKAQATREAQEASKRAERESQADARAVEEFERVQSGATVKQSSLSAEEDKNAGQKRKREEFDAAKSEARDKRIALQALQRDEELQRRSQKGPFWVPSLRTEAAAPDVSGETGDAKKAKKKAATLCPGSHSERDQHPLALKSLLNVQFADQDSVRVCPACSKPLSNSSKPVMAKPCGHVLCGNCCSKFVLGQTDSEHEVDGDAPNLACFVCSEDLGPWAAADKSTSERGLLEISCESHGLVEKKGIAFAFG